jgi:hypothetical protein
VAFTLIEKARVSRYIKGIFFQRVKFQEHTLKL